ANDIIQFHLPPVVSSFGGGGAVRARRAQAETRSGRPRTLFGARRTEKRSDGHGSRGSEDGLRSGRILLALLRVDARLRQRGAKAARRSENSLPVNSQRRERLHSRRHSESHRTQPDSGRQVRRDGERRGTRGGSRRLEGRRRAADSSLGEAQTSEDARRLS